MRSASGSCSSGLREVTASDPDGNTYVYTGRLTSDDPIDFDEIMRGTKS